MTRSVTTKRQLKNYFPYKAQAEKGDHLAEGNSHGHWGGKRWPDYPESCGLSDMNYKFYSKYKRKLMSETERENRHGPVFIGKISFWVFCVMNGLEMDRVILVQPL